MKDLGRLLRLDARRVWTNEASEFTPWLSQNLERLSEAIGMDLELKSVESPVGGFSLDILAHDNKKGGAIRLGESHFWTLRRSWTFGSSITKRYQTMRNSGYL